MGGKYPKAALGNARFTKRRKKRHCAIRPQSCVEQFIRAL
jgi:hypothetical protein